MLHRYNFLLSIKHFISSLFKGNHLLRLHRCYFLKSNSSLNVSSLLLLKVNLPPLHPPQKSPPLVRIFNPSRPEIFSCLFSPICSGFPVLLLFLAKPAPCSLGRPHLLQLIHHGSGHWSTHRGHDPGQAMPLR
jgi:hypothetical protein